MSVWMDREPDISSSADPVASPPASEKLETLYPDDVPDTVPGSDGQPDAAADEAAAPEYKINPPAGFELDRELLSEASPVLREIGLDDANVNKLMPLVGRVQERYLDGLIDEHSALKADWARQTKSDPHLGGKAWPETERLMSIALDAAGASKGSEFRQLMDESGLGNHPAVIRAFRRLGLKLQAMNGGRKPKLSRSEILYPDD